MIIDKRAAGNRQWQANKFLVSVDESVGSGGLNGSWREASSRLMMIRSVDGIAPELHARKYKGFGTKLRSSQLDFGLSSVSYSLQPL